MNLDERFSALEARLAAVKHRLAEREAMRSGALTRWLLSRDVWSTSSSG
jgi:hypothetical protein